MLIYGAGIAGLLAGCLFQTAKIFEAGPENTQGHKALLRFRSTKVADAVGIDFRRVLVHKGIWINGDLVQPDIRLANSYSRKVIGRLADRSIWNIEPVERYIAPENFIDQLIDRCRSRIEWEHAVSGEEIRLNNAEGHKAISTLPMGLMARFLKKEDAPEFKHAGIAVKRWRVPNADVFQTIYFPDRATRLYRASITKDMLIAEYVDSVDDYDFFKAFCLQERDCEPIETSHQRFGKIAPIDDAWRKQFIYELTTSHGVYSLGRFGTWRNLLLDDVVDDVNVVKKLMNSVGYDRFKHNFS